MATACSLLQQMYHMQSIITFNNGTLMKNNVNIGYIYSISYTHTHTHTHIHTHTHTHSHMGGGWDEGELKENCSNTPLFMLSSKSSVITTWPFHLKKYNNSSFSQFDQNQGLKAVKTWPWKPPFCPCQSVSLMSRTKPACVAPMFFMSWTNHNFVLHLKRMSHYGCPLRSSNSKQKVLLLHK